MFTLKIENARGEIFESTHDSANYAVVGVQGLTPPPTAVNTATGGVLDGTFHNSSRVEQRNIVIDVILNGDIEANRQRLYKIFNLKKPCTVYFKNTNRDVKIVGYVEMLEGDLFVQREQIQISIICSRPYFEDLNTIYTELAMVVRMFEFPFAIEATNPIPFSEIDQYPVATVYNSGDVETGCNFHVEVISSVIGGITIYNTTTQEFFGVDKSMFAGDSLDICTISGKLSAILNHNGQQTSVLNQITSGSTWLKLALGENDFTYAVTTGSAENVRIEITMGNLYGGV